MDFRGFYDEIIFDVDKPILKSYNAKQGDTKSRGIYVTVTQRNVVIKDLSGLRMRLFYEKPDKTRGYIDGVAVGNKFRIDYTNQMFAVPGVVRAELQLMGADGEVITGRTFKILVDSSIADGSIVSKDERGILDRAFELAEDIIPRLELLDVELLEDVQNEMLQSQLKVAKIEKELNDYKATMQQINIHQSPTQKASGHGIVSLPKNAVEGQVGVSVKGNTEVDDEGNTKSTVGAIRIKSVGKNLFNKNKALYGHANVNTGRPVWNSPGGITSEFIKVKAGYYTAKFASLDNARANILGFSLNKERILDSNWTSYLTRTIYMPQDGYLVLSVIDDSKSNKTLQEYLDMYSPQLEEGTQATEYEEYQESSLYIQAKDEEGNILVLRSLPNGTKDEIDIANRRLIKRIEVKSNITSGTIINFADMAEGGTYFAWNLNGETEVGVKGDTLGIDATTLIYQLAMPVETPVQVSGSLVSYPSGTVYVEPFVADAGIYTDKMTVLHQDLPIKVLEKLSKIDYTTGLETELDVSDAVISKDKLSFTHPDLVDGDIVFFTYEYDRESTEGETEIEYYDSRYVIKDSVTGKFYKWQITVADGVPSIELEEV